MHVRAAGQVTCVYSGEPHRMAVNCNPDCNPGLALAVGGARDGPSRRDYRIHLGRCSDLPYTLRNVRPRDYHDWGNDQGGVQMSGIATSMSQNLLDAIRSSWAKDTSHEPDAWSCENPARGQCAVTALVVQDYLGGELLRAVSGDITHFWSLVDGAEIDLTAEQFAVRPAWDDASEFVDREYVLAWPDTCRRYALLRGRVAANLRVG